MKSKIGRTLLIVVALLCTGCVAPAQNQKSEVDRFERRLYELNAALGETNLKFDLLGEKLLKLQEQAEANAVELAGLRSTAAVIGPPDDLKVITLDAAYNNTVQEQAPRPAYESPLNADQLYAKGQKLFTSGRYNAARNAFSELVEEFPESTFADNALYWTGETYYSEESFGKALLKFKEIGARYPGENKAPDALLKVAYCHMELQEWKKATDSLKRVVELYPNTSAADKALKTIEPMEGRSGI